MSGCNILAIDQQVKKSLSELPFKELPKIQAKIKDLVRQRERSQSTIQKGHINREIDNLLLQVKELKEGRKLNEYIDKTAVIIERFKLLKPTEIKMNDKGMLEEEFDDYRQSLSDTYIIIANEYMDVHPTKIVSKIQRCCNCGADLDNTGKIKESIATCTTCGVVQEFWKNVKIEPTVEPTSLTTNRENYREIFLILVGEITTDFPTSLFKRLDDYFLQRRIPTYDQARELPLLDDGTKKDTNISSLVSALSSIHQSCYYKYIHALAEKYWGWRLDRHLAYLQPKVMEEYDLLQPLIQTLRTSDKKSNMNIKIRLCYSMWRLGSCRGPGYYKIIKTPDILEEYEYIMKEAYKILGWSSHFITLQEMEEKAKERCLKQKKYF